MSLKVSSLAVVESTTTRAIFETIFSRRVVVVAIIALAKKAFFFRCFLFNQNSPSSSRVLSTLECFA